MEKVNFRHLSRRISEMVQDTVQVAVDHYSTNRNMYTRFRLVPKSMTLLHYAPAFRSPSLKFE